MRFFENSEVVNSSGSLVVEYTYDAWGNILSVTGSLASTLGQANPFRYRGYYYDAETGFYYLNSRYYDPSACRFINADSFVSTGQGILGNNMYAYCGNDPINRVDYSGYFFEEIGEFFKSLFTCTCSTSSDSNSIFRTSFDIFLIGNRGTLEGKSSQSETPFDLHWDTCTTNYLSSTFKTTTDWFGLMKSSVGFNLYGEFQTSYSTVYDNNQYELTISRGGLNGVYIESSKTTINEDGTYGRTSYGGISIGKIVGLAFAIAYAPYTAPVVVPQLQAIGG